MIKRLQQRLYNYRFVYGYNTDTWQVQQILKFLRKARAHGH